MRYLRSNEIVEARTHRQARQLRVQIEQGEEVRQLFVLRDKAGARRKDIRSYSAMLRQKMERVRAIAGVGVREIVRLDDLITVRTAPARDLRHIAADANANPNVSQMLVMSPTYYDYEAIMGEVSDAKDVDGMRSSRVPCTPVAIQEGLDAYGLWKPDLSYTLVGRGRTVNSHVDEALQLLLGTQYKKQVSVITRSTIDELEPALADSDVAIVAAGKRHQIRAGMISPRMKAVVGVCMHDIHPNVYDIPREDLLVTPVHLDPDNWGVGANTASIAIQRTLDSPAPPIS